MAAKPTPKPKGKLPPFMTKGSTPKGGKKPMKGC